MQQVVSNYMVQGPSWKVDNSSSGQKLSRFCGTGRLIVVLLKNAPFELNLSQLKPICILTRTNILRCFPQWSLPFRLCDQNFVCIFHFPHVYYISQEYHNPWFNYPNYESPGCI